MREYEDRHEIEKFYEQAKKNIKQLIEAKGVLCKGSAKGSALSEIISVIDDEMCINIADELCTAKKMCRQYYKKYEDTLALERQYRDAEKKIEEQKKVVDLMSYLTDETLKNVILAYNTIDSGKYNNKQDAKDIVIAYINSKGREDLKDVIEVKTNE